MGLQRQKAGQTVFDAAGAKVLWILLPHGPADKCYVSYYPMGSDTVGAMDPTTQEWKGAMDPTTQLTGG